VTPLEERLQLSGAQHHLLRAYHELLLEINRKHNLISDASAGDFWHRHVLHSLTIADLGRFAPGTTIADWGTGGGLPGIPLAIAFPESRFVLIDSVGKKVRAVQLIIRRLGLANAEAWHGRAERWEEAAHYAVSRATAPLIDLWDWTERVLQPIDVPDDSDFWPQGLIALKGGDLTAEIASLEQRQHPVPVQVTPLEPLLGHQVGRDKVVVHVGPMSPGSYFQADG